MLVSAGFLFVGLKTKAGAGQVKAWNMATNQEYTLEGHTVRARGGGRSRPVAPYTATCTATCTVPCTPPPAHPPARLAPACRPVPAC